MNKTSSADCIICQAYLRYQRFHCLKLTTSYNVILAIIDEECLFSALKKLFLIGL